VTQNPYSAPQTALGGGNDDSADVSEVALAALRRTWLLLAIYGVVSAIASVAGMIGFAAYMRTHLSGRLIPFLLEHAIGLALISMVAGVSITRLRRPGGAARQLASFSLILKTWVAGASTHLIAFIAPFVTYGTVVAPLPSGLATAIADVRLWTRLVMTAIVVVGAQTLAGILSPARLAGVVFVGPQLAFLASRVVNIVLLFIVERACGTYLASRRSVDFDVLAMALRRFAKAMLVLTIVTQTIQYSATLWR
jgi:hypothetical protein